MARFSGKIGYATTSETSPGVWTETIVERQYYGDLTRQMRRWDSSSSSTNDNLTFSQDISIIADPYAFDNLHNMRYVIFRGIRWSIKSIEIDRPRVRLTLGGEWNGNTPGTSD